jgi:Holliday junction resolvasome RuvABC endonuclease subunit
MTHLALDLALSRTGIAWAEGSDVYVCPKKLVGGERLHWWNRTIYGACLPHRPLDRLIVEAPFIHAARPTGSIALIELHGVIRHLAYQHDLEYVTVAPSRLKKEMTGSGKATKADMILDANALRPYEITDHNEADAVLLWHWAAL